MGGGSQAIDVCVIGGGGKRTFEFIFAYVDGGWRVDHVGGEVVDHYCLLSFERDYLKRRVWRYLEV